MKKIILINIFISLSYYGFSNKFNIEEYNDIEIIEAMAWIESRHNKYAVNGDNVGYLQIRPIYVKEVNKYSPRTYKLEDRYSKRKSILMVLDMWTYKYDGLSKECKIRRHNGGVNGCSISSTYNYYKKVCEYLKNNC